METKLLREVDRFSDFEKLMERAHLNPAFVCWLKENNFFTAPASTKYHGSYEGGLYDHSAEVTRSLLDLTESLHLSWQRPSSPLIVGMFHDLCKIDKYEKIVDDAGVMYFGKTEPEGEKAHYEMANPLLSGHGVKSVLLLSRFLILTEEEMLCIRFHMGAYETGDWDALGRAIKQFPNVLFTHTADMIASKIRGV